MFVKVTRK